MWWIFFGERNRNVEFCFKVGEGWFRGFYWKSIRSRFRVVRSIGCFYIVFFSLIVFFFKEKNV